MNGSIFMTISIVSAFSGHQNTLTAVMLVLYAIASVFRDYRDAADSSNIRPQLRQKAGMSTVCSCMASPLRYGLLLLTSVSSTVSRRLSISY